MPTTDTIVIGAGQAGLAMSRCLTDRGVDHVVLERGRVAERWRSERWDSLRLLTPNWMSRLPGWSYRGPDPARLHDGRRGRRLLPGLRRRLRRPRVERTAPCERVRADDDGFEVADHERPLAGRQRRHRHRLVRPPGRAGHGRRAQPTDRARSPPPPTATRRARCPVACSSSAPRPPACSSPTSWPTPGATSCWPSGSHSRMPRRYRGMDIFWWLERIGTLDRTIDEMPRPRRRPPRAVAPARRPPRPPHARPHRPAGRRRRAGRPPHRHRRPSRRLRRRPRPHGGRRRRPDAPGPRRHRRPHRGHRAGAPRCSSPRPTPTPSSVDAARRSIDLAARASARSIWATGYRRTYPWLQVPVLDAHGRDPPAPRRHAGPRRLRARPALPAPPQLQLHRRRRPRRRRSSPTTSHPTAVSVPARPSAAPTGGTCKGADHAP